jgi:hypothetical protein
MEKCGCGAEFEAIAGPTHPYMLSVSGCWKMYGEILAREYQDSRYMENHRLTVDTYAAQHPGVDTAQARNSVGVHLTRLCLILDFGWPIERANDAMVQIAGRKSSYPWLAPPCMSGALTVQAVLQAQSPDEHENVVRAWARSVWNKWASHHEIVHQWAKLLRKETR